MRYEIRAAGVSDEEQLLRLSRFLNTVNLPHDRQHVRRLLEHASQSFNGEIKERHRKYVFVLWDLEQDLAVGTSMIVAQLGRRDAPYIYLEVSSEEKYSNLLDKHFHHTVLRLGFSYDGATEIGGLVVDPAYRGASERLGLLISYVRFLYIARHRALFRNEILAELLPPLEPDGTSHLWEALGRHFTDMSYADADVLSSENKGFIRDLFPSGPIYASLLSLDAQEVIGKVGAQTRGVEKMLRRVGFRYAERIDPFDGGPHFVAEADEISLVRDTVATVMQGELAEGTAARLALVAREFDGPPYFRAVATQVALTPDGAHVAPAAARHLELGIGTPLAVLPLP
ncbi:MAG TPA: arginine N-succinyltransferase [Polyangiaceae bacterium]